MKLKSALSLALIAVGLSVSMFALAYYAPPPAFTPPHHKVGLSDYAYQTFVLGPMLSAYEFTGPGLMYRTYAELSVAFLVVAALAALSAIDYGPLSRLFSRRVEAPKEMAPFVGVTVGAGLLIYLGYQGVNTLYTVLKSYQALPWVIRQFVWPLVIDPTLGAFPYAFGIYAFTGFAMAAGGVFVWEMRHGIWASAKRTVCFFCAPLIAAPLVALAIGNFHVESDHVTNFLAVRVPFPGATSWAPVYLFSNWTVLAVSLFFMASGLASFIKARRRPVK